MRTIAQESENSMADKRHWEISNWYDAVYKQKLNKQKIGYNETEKLGNMQKAVLVVYKFAIYCRYFYVTITEILQ